ncbi:AI-2E family transporter [Moraxella oblonga]|uniref:AI-2E family transporter n=1 Tax=Moraxella oblonga TaxID=200413 RepID=UPI000834A0EE|nr:AI-2E family transporter [Moraxella oblonga]
MTSHNYLKILVGTASLMIVLAGIKLSASLLVPFLISLFIAIICSPLINFLTRHKIPHWIAIGVLFFILSLILVFVGGLVNSSIAEFTRSMPQYEKLMLVRIDELVALAKKWHLPFEFNANMITDHLNVKSIFSFMGSLMGGMSSVASNIFVLVLMVVFMLFEAPDFKHKLAFVLEKTEKHHHISNTKINLILDSVIHYLGLKALISLLTGFCVWVLLTLLGVQYAVLWATLSFLLNFVPNIGSVIASVPVILQAFLLNDFSVSMSVLIGMLLINGIIGNVLEPKIMGKNLGLSTLMVFLSLLFWGWLLGVVGMLLSVPLTMVIKIILESNPNTAHYAVLMGNDNAQSLAKNLPQTLE